LKLSVIIPTHNPSEKHLESVLLALAAQTLLTDCWELLIVDNGSTRPLSSATALMGHPQGRVIREERLGLTSARLAGFEATQGEIIVLVDDDNELATDYLAAALKIANDYPFLGTWSGNIELKFEPSATPPPPDWRPFLAERSCKSANWSNHPSHNDSTPWGAGLCVRRAVAAAYLLEVSKKPEHLSLDLHGSRLIYGGDTDIAFVGCSLGLGKGVFPILHLRHLILASRCERAYLVKVVEGRGYSEVLHQFVGHGALPPEQRNRWGKLKRLLRLATMSRDDRAIALAFDRGRRRAFKELSGRQ
jgi:glycosyltransferase involved in cell wall biosynthesis